MRRGIRGAYKYEERATRVSESGRKYSARKHSIPKIDSTAWTRETRTEHGVQYIHFLCALKIQRELCAGLVGFGSRSHGEKSI